MREKVTIHGDGTASIRLDQHEWGTVQIALLAGQDAARAIGGERFDTVYGAVEHAESTLREAKP